MTHKEFCYWLKGYFELSEANTLTEKQVEEIKRHLNILFNNPVQLNDVRHIYPVHFQTHASC